MRHTGTGEQSPATRTPEAGSRATAYGSAVHDAIAALEEGHGDEQAVQLAWDTWGHRLQPEDLQLLHDDVEDFHHRDFPNVRTVLAEDEIRVPLTLATGELVYFRARIDRLYERVDRPGSFILVDYKSSRWARSESEVQEDLQLRAYDWSLHEYLPEIEELLCIYDQLRYGQIPVRFSEKSRHAMRGWLAAQMGTYFADDDVQEDGLLAPRYNQWCPWCPILESCPIVEQLSDFALTRIEALGEHDVGADGGMDRYSELYSMAKGAGKVLDRFVKSMNEVARELPADERQRLGYQVTERRNMTFSTQALEELHARLGSERFLELVSLPKTRLDSLDDGLKEWALSLMEPAAPTTVMRRT